MRNLKSICTILGGMLWVGSGIGACSDSLEEELRAASLAQGCTIHSDCESPLVCAFERCHQECNEDRDCPDTQRCVRGDGEFNVCQLPDETFCDRDKDCAGEQVCALDGECRDLCSADSDCIGDQVCAQSGHCASTVAGKDRLTDDNRLVPEGSGTGGQGGSPATSGGQGSSAEGGVANGGKGGSGGAGAAGGSGGEAGSGDGASGGEGGEDAANGAGGAPSGPVVVSETEPNDTRDDRQPYAVGSIVEGEITTKADVDYFEVVAPDSNPAGGYFTASLSDVGTAGALQVRVFAAVDNGLVLAPWSGAGESIYLFWAAAPGQEFHVAVNHLNSGVPVDYDLQLEFTEIPDTYEPNDTRDEAQPIEVNTPILAYLTAGHRAGSVELEDFYDWYAVTLAEGEVTLTLSSVPTTTTIGVQLYNSLDQIVAQLHSSTMGAGVSLTEDVPAGSYKLRVGPYTDHATAGATEVPWTAPNHFSDTYQLFVTQ